MNKLSALLVVVTLLLGASLMAGCENKVKTEEHNQTVSDLEMTKQQLESLQKDSSKLEDYVDSLKKEITDLKIENQKLVAESKRLEAQIIDLKLELGDIPDEQSSVDTSDDGTSPTDTPEAQPTDQNSSGDQEI